MSNIKITSKAFNSFKRAEKGEGLCFNDSVNLANFGITKAQGSALRKVCGVLGGMEWAKVSLASVNKALAGDKTCGAVLSDDVISMVKKAFA
jgi:hypothetical protein